MIKLWLLWTEFFDLVLAEANLENKSYFSYFFILRYEAKRKLPFWLNEKLSHYFLITKGMRIIIEAATIRVNSKEIEAMLRIAIEQVVGQKKALKAAMNFQNLQFQTIFVPKMHYFFGPQKTIDSSKYMYGSSFSHDKTIFIKNSPYARDQAYESYGNLETSSQAQNHKITYLFETLVAPSHNTGLSGNMENFFREQKIQSQLDVTLLKVKILGKGLIRDMEKVQPSQAIFEGETEYKKLESGILIQSGKMKMVEKLENIQEKDLDFASQWWLKEGRHEIGGRVDTIVSQTYPELNSWERAERKITILSNLSYMNVKEIKSFVKEGAALVLSPKELIDFNEMCEKLENGEI